MIRALIVASALFACGVARADNLDKVFGLLEASRLDLAKPIVEAEAGGPNGPFLEGLYALYDGAYAEAARKLDEAVTGGTLHPKLALEAASLRDMARRTDEITRGFVTRRSDHFEIKVAPGKDEVLIEPALAGLERALTAIGGDLAALPEAPIRVEVYGDVSDLAKASPLTVEAIKASGTIALCKYNRLMITSPRALVAGYPWIDTMSHELTHYLVNHFSLNTVPIWLHEGIAKLEERRWREPFGGRLPLQLEHLLASGLRDGHLVTFAAMHPSMALLPTQKEAGLAYAEVVTAVQYIIEDRGLPGLRKLLLTLRGGMELSRAIQLVTGVPFATFEKQWKAWLRTRGYKTHPELGMMTLHFKDAGKPAKDEDDIAEQAPSSTPGERKGRGHVRLGTMLRTRGRLGAAAVEYERASALLGVGHPEVAGKLGRTYLELKDWDHAIAAARPGIARQPDSAGLQATVGRALLEKGAVAEAQPFLEGALAINPYDPKTRCGLQRIYGQLNDPRASSETAACATLGGRK